MFQATKLAALVFLGLAAQTLALPGSPSSYGGSDGSSSTTGGATTPDLTCSLEYKTDSSIGETTYTTYKATTVYVPSVYSSPVPTTETKSYQTTIVVTNTVTSAKSKPYIATSTGYSYFDTTTAIRKVYSTYKVTTIVSTIPIESTSTGYSTVEGSSAYTKTLTKYSAEVVTTAVPETKTSDVSTTEIGTGYEVVTTQKPSVGSSECVETKPFTYYTTKTESKCAAATSYGSGW